MDFIKITDKCPVCLKQQHKSDHLQYAYCNANDHSFVISGYRASILIDDFVVEFLYNDFTKLIDIRAEILDKFSRKDNKMTSKMNVKDFTASDIISHFNKIYEKYNKISLLR